MFEPLFLVKGHNLWLQWRGSGDKERFSGPGSKVQRDKREPPAGLR